MVISASQKVTLRLSSTQTRYTGIQKLAPEMQADIARVAMTKHTRKRYQYMRSISMGNPFFNYGLIGVIDVITISIQKSVSERWG